MKKAGIFILIMISYLANCQETVESFTINWKNPRFYYGSSSLYFEGVSYQYQNEKVLPNFNFKKDISLSKSVTRVELLDAVYTALSREENKIVKDWNIQLHPFDLNYEILKANNQNSLNVYFIPVRKNTQTGEYEKLHSGKLKITYEDKPVQRKKIEKSVANSVLSTGKWVKIKIKNSGIYKISYSQMVEMGLDNLNNIRVYGNSFGLLSEQNADKRPDDLIENSIFISDGGDGNINDGDFILFYAKASTVWKYNETKDIFQPTRHLYSDYSYYFLTTDLGPGKHIEPQETVDLPATSIVTSYNNYALHELNDTNLIRSGKKFVGEHFYNLLNHNFEFDFTSRITSEPISLTYNLVARSSNQYDKSSFDIIINNDYSQLKNVEINNVNLGSHTGSFAQQSNGTTSFLSNSNSLSVLFVYNQRDNTSEGWLDYFYINVRENLVFKNQMQFRDALSTGIGNVVEYRITSENSNVSIWDVSIPTNPENISLTNGESYVSFKANADSLKEYIAFDGSSFYSITDYEVIENQNLHGLPVCDMIIITPQGLNNYASELADFHLEHDNIKAEIVFPEQIYNEFSSGMPDVASIRDFVRHMYQKNDASNSLKYLLLFGDGSYDNREESINGTNLLLTYQSDESLSYTTSFVTDDFFGMLDENEGENYGDLDIGIGRIPVLTEEAAGIIINKIKNYYSSASFGDWRNTLCFIADDADENQTFHMSDANDYTKYINTNYPVFNIDKIFLDAYPQESTPEGQRYPEVNQAIDQRINKGALLINYTGHGNPKVLTDEQVVTVPQIKSWNNFNKLAVFVTATCEFSRYDDKGRVSAGEYIMTNPNGGALAMLTTSRLVYAGANNALNTNFYKFVFEENLKGEYYRLGDIVKLTKNATGYPGDINKRNFSLLGDPACKLAIPKYHIKTDSINQVQIQFENDSLISKIDTLKALSKVSVCGRVVDVNGILVQNIDGTTFPTILDKFKSITTLSNDGANPLTYNIQKNILYKGKASVNGGLFKFDFIVPRDIAYNYGMGKLSFYFSNDNLDATGYFENIVIGGSNDNVNSDKLGPEIKLYMNDENFVFGGTTNNNPILIAMVNDSSGINTVGNGIGHDIKAIIDDNSTQSLILNDYYEADLDSYQNGKIEYNLTNLSDGNHNLSLKVWDIYNNPSEEYIEFIVAENSEIALEHVFNYPNPFTSSTAFYFDHNQPNSDLDIQIQIFSVSGKLIKTISEKVTTTGFRINPIPWDGLDDFGDRIARGVYIYKLSVKTSDNRSKQKIEKLVILR